jgi:hypothetical protein
MTIALSMEQTERTDPLSADQTSHVAGGRRRLMSPEVFRLAETMSFERGSTELQAALGAAFY